MLVPKRTIIREKIVERTIEIVEPSQTHMGQAFSVLVLWLWQGVKSWKVIAWVLKFFTTNS